ncbi:MAG: GNAT family N-acetyltransferase [Candidatus Marinimicrobia bacterium]|nr:GNAT family N-acetyltransferase [Candidatus Neomarinimicrobiota bacterium]
MNYREKLSDRERDIDLKPFLREDIEKAIDWIPSPEFSVYMQNNDSDDKARRQFFEKRIVQGNLGSSANLLFKVLDANTNQVIGYCDLSNIDEVNRSAELSHVVVGPLHLRGLGLDSKIIFSLMRIAFQVLQLNRLYVRILNFDQNSITLYKSLGFQEEGNFPESFKHQDKYWDLKQLAIVKSQWDQLHNTPSLN